MYIEMHPSNTVSQCMERCILPIHYCLENGRIFTWGRGVSGVLGHGDNKNRSFRSIVCY